MQIRKVRKLLLAVVLLLSTAGCLHGMACPTPAPGAGPGQVPDCILEKSNQIVISRLGKAFFREHVLFQPALSSYNEADPYCVQDPTNCAEFLSKPYYRMVYSFSVPDLPGTDLSAEFFVDVAGNLVSGAAIDGLPNCVRDRKECTFAVTDQALAIEIAEKADLEPGLDEWRTHFHWYAGELNTYVWTVENTLTIDKSTGESSGRTIVIDANSGTVLQIGGWVKTP